MRALLSATLVTVFAFAASLEGQAPSGLRSPGTLRMALVNIRCVYSDSPDPKANQAALQLNLNRHRAFVDRLAREGVDFVGFPELSVNGYHFSKTMTWLRLDGPEVESLKKLAIEKGVYLSVGLAEVDADGKHWNTQIVIDP